MCIYIYMYIVRNSHQFYSVGFVAQVFIIIDSQYNLHPQKNCSNF